MHVYDESILSDEQSCLRAGRKHFHRRDGIGGGEGGGWERVRVWYLVDRVFVVVGT